MLPEMAAPKKPPDLDLGSLEVRPTKKTSLRPEKGLVTAVFRVSRPGYVPEGVRVRARVDDTLFTGECQGARLESLKADPGVAAVEPARKVSPAR